MANNKKFNNRIMLLTGAAIIFLFLFFKFRFPSEEKVIVAQVGDREITLTEFSEFEKLTGKELTPTEKKEALDFLVTQEIIKIYAHESGFINENLQEQFDKEKEYGYNNVLVEQLIKQEIDDKIKAKIKEKDKKQYFKTHEFMTLAFIAVSDLHEDAKEKILLAKGELERGTPFLNVLENFGDEAFQKEEGSLGIYEKGDSLALVEPFYSKSKNLNNVGDHSEVFKTSFGYVIIYRRENPKYYDVKETIRDKIFEERRSNALTEYLDKLGSNISLNKDFIYTIPSIEPDDYNSIEISTKILASFDDGSDPIIFSQFMKRMKDINLLEDFRTKDYQDVLDIVNNLALEKLLIKEAYKKEIQKTKSFIYYWNQVETKYIEDQGIKIVESVMESRKINLAEDELLNYYNEHNNDFKGPGHFKFKQIVLDNYNDAYSLYKRLMNKELKFDDAIKNYSMENNVEFSGGTTPYLTYEDMKDNYQFIERFGIGDIVQPLMIDGKYVIYQVIDRQPGAVQAFSAVKGRVQTKLLVEKLDKWINDIKKEYNIIVTKYYENLEPRRKY